MSLIQSVNYAECRYAKCRSAECRGALSILTVREEDAEAAATDPSSS
jgi:hypothetical protein